MSTVLEADVAVKLLTAEEYFLTSDPPGMRSELVRGEVIIMAQPGFRHGRRQGLIFGILEAYAAPHKLGRATCETGIITERGPDTVRGPDVAFVSWARLPNGRIPTEAVPDLVPNFVIEVLSVGNTYAEMSRKRREYFHAGVELLWMVDHRSQTVTVFRSPQDASVVNAGETLDGGSVLPGWHIDIADLFSRLERSEDTK